MKTCRLCEATSAGTAVRFPPRSPLCDWCVDSLARRGMRLCLTCGGVFPTAQAIATFPTRCPACRTAKRRAKYEANLERERAAAQAWDDANPGVAATKKRLRYATDPAYRAACQARKRAWYARNRPHAIAYAVEYMRRHSASVLRWRAASRDRRSAYLRTFRLRRKLAILRGAA